MSKYVNCSYEKCGDKESWTNPGVPRGTRKIEVPDDFIGPIFCSLECALFAEFLPPLSDHSPEAKEYNTLYWEGKIKGVGYKTWLETKNSI